MNTWNLGGEQTWRLRKELTVLNKALLGAEQHPNGITKFVVENIRADKVRIKAEIKRRQAVLNRG